MHKPSTLEFYEKSGVIMLADSVLAPDNATISKLDTVVPWRHEATQQVAS